MLHNISHLLETGMFFVTAEGVHSYNNSTVPSSAIHHSIFKCLVVMKDVPEACTNHYPFTFHLYPDMINQFNGRFTPIKCGWLSAGVKCCIIHLKLISKYSKHIRQYDNWHSCYLSVLESVLSVWESTMCVNLIFEEIILAFSWELILRTPLSHLENHSYYYL